MQFACILLRTSCNFLSSVVIVIRASELLAHGFTEEILQTFIDTDILLRGERRVTIPGDSSAELWLQTNNFCNLTCMGCATGMDRKQDRSSKFTPEEVEIVLQRVVRDARDYGFKALKVKLGGGEASLMHSSFIEHVAMVVRALRVELPINLVLLTNGISLSDRLINILKNNEIHSSVSTDPTREIGGRQALPRVLRNIERLRMAGASVSTQYTVTAENVSSMLEVYDTLADSEIFVHFSLFRAQHPDQLALSERTKIIPALMQLFERMLKRIRQGHFVGDCSTLDYFRTDRVTPATCGAQLKAVTST